MRERIMIGGEGGSGKTHTILTIAQGLPDCKVRIIETDDGVRKLLALCFPDVKNVDVRTVHSWPEFRAQVDAVQADVKAGKLGPLDWVAIDGADIVHSFTRYEFVRRVYAGRGEGTQSTWDTIIAKRRGGGPIMEPSDWDGIYMEYEGGFNPLVFEMPCNLVATTGVTLLNPDSMFEDKNLVQWYRSMGMFFKYDGYKRLPRQFDTMITLSFDPNGYYFSIWKDRGSRGMQNAKVGERYANSNFFNSYLIMMAGYGG